MCDIHLSQLVLTTIVVSLSSAEAQRLIKEKYETTLHSLFLTPDTPIPTPQISLGSLQRRILLIGCLSLYHIIAEPTHTMTRRMVSHPTTIYVVYAHAQKASHVTQLTASSTPLYRGAFLIRETGIITGRGYMAAWNGTATSVPPSQILSPWESRSAGSFKTLSCTRETA